MANALERRIQASLESRAARLILRRVDPPAPTSSSSPGHLIDFSSNDYLSLSTNNTLRSNFLQKLGETELVLGSGGSRLLDGNTPAHFALETRLQQFFNAPAALLFNSGFDANVALFTTLPQQGDTILLDELIHASVWDGCRSSRAKDSITTFKHNCIFSLRAKIAHLLREDTDVRSGEHSVFIAVETLYSMDGDFAPLREIVEVVEAMLPRGNGHIIVDEAHATAVYGPQGRGITALLGLEERITVRLHTFGKALGSNGAVVVCSPLIRSYLCNYGRSLIFTTALSHANLISIGCSFDMLESGEAQKFSNRLKQNCDHFFKTMRPHLKGIPSKLLALPPISSPIHPELSYSPIIPVLTTQPRPLAGYLQSQGYLARPITWPTVPKGQDRVRVCLHSANMIEDVEGLVVAMIAWAQLQLKVPSISEIEKRTANAKL